MRYCQASFPVETPQASANSPLDVGANWTMSVTRERTAGSTDRLSGMSSPLLRPEPLLVVLLVRPVSEDCPAGGSMMSGWSRGSGSGTLEGSIPSVQNPPSQLNTPPCSLAYRMNDRSGFFHGDLCLMML